MCKADMTPIVLIPPEKSGIPVPMPEFRTTHVCRNFEKLKNWVRTERAAGLGKEKSLKIAQKIREKTRTKY
jgi:Mycotoxin biosynthesis protein UstYa